MKKFLFVSLLVAMLFGCASQSQIARTLKNNPQMVLDALGEDKVALLNLVEQGARERQMQKLVETWKMRAADPVKPVIEDGRAFLGNADAEITIVEYSDFLCPYCSRGARTVNDLVKKSDGRIRVVYKHMPQKKYSYDLAVMYEAIALQDTQKAWAFGERVFASQRAAYEGGPEMARKLAEELDVDMSKLDKDIKSPVVVQRVQNDITEASRFGVTGTPTFFINGTKVEGAISLQQFEKAIDVIEEIQKTCVECDLQ